MGLKTLGLGKRPKNVLYFFSVISGNKVRDGSYRYEYYFSRNTEKYMICEDYSSKRIHKLNLLQQVNVFKFIIGTAVT